MYLPLFQGTISNWTIESKGVSWTGMGYSFIISTSIKQVKDLELILSVPFVFGSWCCETTLCGQRIVVKGPHCVVSIQVKQTIVRLQKQNKSIREIAGTLGVAKSTVWYILRKKNRMHWWAQQHKKFELLAFWKVCSFTVYVLNTW